jgi:decaprenylphospho-beta-D-erythro-pentofuranosid-2-ulose 2-reductase
MKQKIVIIGATSSIAEHCARLWIAQNTVKELVLVGRNANKLDRIKNDLVIRANGLCDIQCLNGDLISAQSVHSLVQQACSDTCPDLVLIAQGSLPDQTACESDLPSIIEAFNVNAISPCIFAESFVSPMLEAGKGCIAVIGSVAGDRGRKSNYVYGSAKSAVARYVQGLQHRLAFSPVRAVLIKPGPTDTPMTRELKSLGRKLATLDNVAQTIVKGLNTSAELIYAPGKWALIMMIIRHLPKFVFNKINI